MRALILRDGVAKRSRDLKIEPFPDFVRTDYWEQRLRDCQQCECCLRNFDMNGNRGKENKGPSNASPTIDRIVPALGYVKENVALLCWRCNNLKRDATIPELECIVKWMKTKV